jgi:hypothetical protein
MFSLKKTLTHLPKAPFKHLSGVEKKIIEKRLNEEIQKQVDR